MRQTLKWKGPLWEQRNMFGARIKILWEEQLVDSLIHYITSIIAPRSWVLNNTVSKPWTLLRIYNKMSIIQVVNHKIKLRNYNRQFYLCPWSEKQTCPLFRSSVCCDNHQLGWFNKCVVSCPQPPDKPWDLALFGVLNLNSLPVVTINEQ